MKGKVEMVPVSVLLRCFWIDMTAALLYVAFYCFTCVKSSKFGLLYVPLCSLIYSNAPYSLTSSYVCSCLQLFCENHASLKVSVASFGETHFPANPFK